MSNYRVLVTFDPERSVFVARAPELEHCSGEGATRAEALTKIEEEIDAQLRNMREQGGSPPPWVDDAALAFSGEIATKVSRTLHRDLSWQARLEGIEVGQLVSEIVAAGLEIRRATRRRPSTPPQERDPREAREPRDNGNDAQPPRRDDRPGPGNDRRPQFRQGGGPGGGRYHAIMEDRATFLEYVRGLESGGGRGGGGGGGGGQGGMGQQGRGQGRRGRGRSGPGGGQGAGGAGGDGGSPGDDGPK